MISLMTDLGTFAFSQALSGATKLLPRAAVLMADGAWDTVKDAAKIGFEEAPVESGNTFSFKIKGSGAAVVGSALCQSVLPVKITLDDVRYALDLDFSTQIPSSNGSGSSSGISSPVKYNTVVVIGAVYKEYATVTVGTTYSVGDHVLAGGNAPGGYVYVCLTDNYNYTDNSPTPNNDPDNWLAVALNTLNTYPGTKTYYFDPAYDWVPLYITQYDDDVTLSNSMALEYKIRINLYNITSGGIDNDYIQRIETFARGSIENDGSLMVEFLAGLAQEMRAYRDLVSSKVLTNT